MTSLSGTASSFTACASMNSIISLLSGFLGGDATTQIILAHLQFWPILITVGDRLHNRQNWFPVDGKQRWSWRPLQDGPRSPGIERFGAVPPRLRLACRARTPQKLLGNDVVFR